MTSPAVRNAEVQELLDGLVGSGAATAAVALAGTEDEQFWGGAGRTRASGGRPVRLTDRFDLASLTKPVTATLALALDNEGKLPLGTRLGDIWGDEVCAALARAPLESLLRHRAGLRAWAPLYRYFRSSRRVPGYLLSNSAVESRRERYSDLDVILWGLSAERALGTGYDALLKRHVLSPLGLRGVERAPGDCPSVVESRLSNRRELELAASQGVRVGLRRRVPVGSVQDGNSRFLGAGAAHAGLFASAQHLFALAREWLRPDRVLSQSAVRRALTGGRSFVLGWRRRTLRGSGGPGLGPSAFGHVGFTGGSLWIDPEADRIHVLLAHRASASDNLGSWRRRLHRLATSRSSKRVR